MAALINLIIFGIVVYVIKVFWDILLTTGIKGFKSKK